MITDYEKQSVESMYPSKDNLSYLNSPSLSWYRDLSPYPLRETSSNNGLDPVTRQDARTVEEFHCKMFDMTNEEDVTLYSVVKQRILSGWYTQCKELTKWDSSEVPLLIWLEWIQTYKEI